MPWRIEAGGKTYTIDTGDSVEISAPLTRGDETLVCRADKYLNPYLALFEPGTPEGAIYLFPTINRYEEILAKRNIRITYIDDLSI